MTSRALSHDSKVIGINQADPWTLITPREQEVLGLYMTLLNDKKVARTLGTRPQTVRNQLASIMHKLNTRSRIELIALLLSKESHLDHDWLESLNHSALLHPRY